LQRIADQSVVIARRAKHLDNQPGLRELALLEAPYRLTVTIFHDSLRAFADGDYELARTLKRKDSELDALTDEVSEGLVERGTEVALRTYQVTWILSLLPRPGSTCRT
jgi:phosphate uptake regulator